MNYQSTINKGIELLALCQQYQTAADGVERPAVGTFDRTKTLDQFARDINETATYLMALNQLLPMQSDLADLARALEAQGKIQVDAGDSYALAALNYFKSTVNS